MKYRSMMSSSDAIIWNVEQDPQLRSTVMSVWILDAPPTPQRMAVNVDRMVAAIPRLRQRVVEARPRPRWEAVAVDLAHHYKVDALPEGSTLTQVLEYAEQWVREPFDRSRPQWKLGLLTGLEGGKAGIVIKVHHAIADGLGMVLMLGAFLDFEANPTVEPIVDAVEDVPAPRELYTTSHRLVVKARAAVGRFLRRPFGSSADAMRTVRSAIRLVTPHRTPLSPLMTRRSGELHMDTRQLPLRDFKAAGASLDATLNDTFVAITADAVARYHRASGSDCPELRLHIPVNIRNERTAVLAGNQWVPARLSLQLGSATLRDEAASIRDQLLALGNEPALHHINTVSAAIQRLGKPISRWIIGGMMKGVDVLASNVPGPPFPMYLAGARIEEFFGFGPPAGAALNITLFSYDGSVWLGITTDAAAVVNRALFLGCLDDAIVSAVPVPIASPA